MIVGHNHHRLEKRIAAALLSGIPYPREAYFLQQMSRRILHKGNDTFLSDRQAARLLEIFARCEKSPPSKQQGSTRCLPNPQPEQEGPEPLNFEDCLVDSQSPAQNSPTPTAPNVPAPLTTRAPEPTGTQDTQIGSIFKRVLARNENLRKRQERVEQQRLKSTSA